MPTKMRLQRYGKKGQAYYHIVIADGRAPRDGRFTEKIGTYNPITRPADIKLDFDRALYWVKTGAEPTETVAAILKYTGVAYMHHLLKGVEKGAMNEEQAQAKFEAWKAEKTAKIDSAKKDYLLKGKTSDKKRFEAEVKVNEAKADELAKKRAAAAGLDAKAQAALAAETAEAAEVAKVAESAKGADVNEIEEVAEVPEVAAVADVKAEEIVPEVPVAPVAPEVPEAPVSPEVPEVPEAPETPEAPKAPEAPEATEEQV
jgi:small subunit ribosomal protein S16